MHKGDVRVAYWRILVTEEMISIKEDKTTVLRGITPPPDHCCAGGLGPYWPGDPTPSCADIAWHLWPVLVWRAPRGGTQQSWCVIGTT